MAATTEVTHLQLSPRIRLEPGDEFRNIKGTGPYYGQAKTRLGPFGTFTLLGFEQNRTRVYVHAEKDGRHYTLYVAGPRYQEDGGSVYEPFRLKKVS